MFYSARRLFQALFVIVVFCSFFSNEISAQAKKPASKKTDKNAKTVVNNSKSSKSVKPPTDNKNTKSIKNDSKSKTETAKKAGKASDKKTEAKNEAKNKETAKQTQARKAEEARRLAEKRKADEERRQAALAEQRRREQARREAAARILAFERGLRTETVANIAEDNTEGEDLQIRRAAVEALGNRAGTVVVMESQTGKVLTMVNQDWAVRRGFKPCSTIKVVTGVAGVNEKLIDTDGNLRKQNFRMNLDDALAYSNNSYFQKVGANLGNQKMISYARALGLGEPTGINSENETSGKLPYDNNNARIYSHGDDFEVSPLQLAVMVSAVSNGGKLVVPKTPRTAVEKANFRGFMRRETNLPQETLRGVLPGMIGAAEYGTARRAAFPNLNVAGKTGSCIGQGSWVGLFASVAPAVNPQYTVVVVTRGQGERGKYASQVAGKVYQALSSRFNSKEREMIAKLPLQVKPVKKVDAKTSTQLDSEEGEDSDEGDALKSKPNPKKGLQRETSENTNTTSTQNRQNNNSVKNAPNSFDPIVIEFKRDATVLPNDNKPRVTRPRVVKTNQ